LAGVFLLHVVGAFDADLLVMGAYGRSRMRERVFGGATRRVLEEALIPVLMQH
jgi:nucleotide-binding universal stress UspA family protein